MPPGWRGKLLKQVGYLQNYQVCYGMENLGLHKGTYTALLCGKISGSPKASPVAPSSASSATAAPSTCHSRWLDDSFSLNYGIRDYGTPFQKPAGFI